MKVGDRVRAPRYKSGIRGFTFLPEMESRIGEEALVFQWVSSNDGVLLKFNDGSIYGYPFEAFKAIDEATQILDDKDKFMCALKHAYEAGQSDVNKSFNQWVFETLQSTLNDK